MLSFERFLERSKNTSCERAVLQVIYVNKGNLSLYKNKNKT